MALARRLLRLRPHLATLPLPPPSPPRLLQSRTYISDMRRSALVDRLLRSVRSEISFLDNSAPPPSPPAPAPFAVEDCPGEQWARLRRVFPAAEGEEEEVRVDATLVDGALPPSRSGADTGGQPRLHISVKVEVSKAARPGVALNFECSAWPDEMEVQRVFPVRRGGPSPLRQYVGRQFSCCFGCLVMVLLVIKRRYVLVIAEIEDGVNCDQLIIREVKYLGTGKLS
ncbi:uncharacterized protein LOC120712472 isoform X2 [Panicum virgatum]|uniref:uncharacterized protein LOC120712472 isoform X2 n=1 Tax=Panicum virgatum TaxID=38727 RepID=UPI0019D508C7|nr:uncharacterized protein LOC120712472 isoform X2 [Panicum virgatum]